MHIGGISYDLAKYTMNYSVKNKKMWNLTFSC